MTLDEEKRSSSEEEKSDGVQSVLVRPDGTDDDALMAAAEEMGEATLPSTTTFSCTTSSVKRPLRRSKSRSVASG